LRVDVAERAVHTKARALRRAHNALPHAIMHVLPVRVT